MDRDNVQYVCPFCDSAALSLRAFPSFTSSILSDFIWHNSSSVNLVVLFDLYSKVVH